MKKRTKFFGLLAVSAMCALTLTAAVACAGSGNENAEAPAPAPASGEVHVLFDGKPAADFGEDGDLCLTAVNGKIYRKTQSEWVETEFRNYTLENGTLTVTYPNGETGTFSVQETAEGSETHKHNFPTVPVVIYESYCVVPGIGVKTCGTCNESFVEILPADPDSHDLHDFSYAGETVQKCSFCSYSPDHGYLYEVKKDSSLTEVFEQAEQDGTVILGDDMNVTEEDMLDVGENKDLTLDVNGNTMTVVKENEEAESGHQGLTVGKGGSLTITDSTASEEASGSGVFIVDYKTVNGNRDSHEDGDYGLTVEGTLNVEGVKFQVNNETSDHSVYVDGGTVNFSDAEIKMNGKTTASSVPDSDHLEDYGFGIGIFIGNGGSMKIENTTINAEGNITPFMVGFGTSEDKSELYLGEGTNLVWKNPFNLNGAGTVASALQVYTNGVLSVDEGATVTLEGSSFDPNHYNGTNYTWVHAINCVGGGEVTMNGTLNLFLQEGTTSGIMVTTNYTRDEDGAINGFINDTHVTIGSSAHINVKTPRSSTGYVFVCVAQRNGTQSYDSVTGRGELKLANVSYSVEIQDGAKIMLIQGDQETEMKSSFSWYSTCLGYDAGGGANLDEYVKDAVLDNRAIAKS